VRDDGVNFGTYRCNNASCSNASGLNGVNVASPEPFVEHEYRVQYDGDRTFTALLDGVIVGQVVGNSRVGPPRVPTRHIGVGVNAPSGGRVEAEFFEVLVGGATYDDFAVAGDRIDLTRWSNGDLVRSPRGGRLAIVQAQKDFGFSNALRLENPESHRAIAADVAVDALETVGANTRLRLLEFLYNDGTTGAGPGSRVGDIGAEVSMNDTEAFVLAFRCTNADCSTVTQLTNPSGNGRLSLGPTPLGSRHTLYLAWGGARVTAQLDARAPLLFDPVAAGAPIVSAAPSSPLVTIGSRVSASSGQQGYVRGTFDALRTGP
jgi:hypothetical protein